ALGHVIDLSMVRAPMFLLAASDDEVVAPEQLLAVRRLVGSEAGQIRTEIAACTHLRLFMGATTLRQTWPEISRWLAACCGAAPQPSAGAGGASALFPLPEPEFIQRFLMQEANLSQVSLRFFDVMPYGTELVPDCNLARMIQRGFKPLDAKRSTSGKGISLLY